MFRFDAEFPTALPNRCDILNWIISTLGNMVRHFKEGHVSCTGNRHPIPRHRAPAASYQ